MRMLTFFALAISGFAGEATLQQNFEQLLSSSRVAYNATLGLLQQKGLLQKELANSVRTKNIPPDKFIIDFQLFLKAEKELRKAGETSNRLANKLLWLLDGSPLISRDQLVEGWLISDLLAEIAKKSASSDAAFHESAFKHSFQLTESLLKEIEEAKAKHQKAFADLGARAASSDIVGSICKTVIRVTAARVSDMRYQLSELRIILSSATEEWRQADISEKTLNEALRYIKKIDEKIGKQEEPPKEKPKKYLILERASLASNSRVRHFGGHGLFVGLIVYDK